MKKLVVVLSIVAFVSAAQAGFTDVNPTPWKGPIFKEYNLAGPGNSIMNHLYGKGNYRRINDSFDGLWSYGADSATAVFEAKFSSIGKASFGYFEDDAFVSLFTVSKFGYARTEISKTFKGDEDPFAFGALFGTARFGNLYSSNAEDNYKDLDHMVTYKILSGDSAGAYVLAWEDNRCLGDRDYQDLVVQVTGVNPSRSPSPIIVPVPGAMVLGSLGLGLVGWLRRGRTL